MLTCWLDIPSLTIDSIREGLRTRQFSAAELTEEVLRFAEAENPKTNAYLHFSPERALPLCWPTIMGGVNLAQKVTEICRGKAYFRTPYTLGQYLLMDYINRKTRTIH